MLEDEKRSEQENNTSELKRFLISMIVKERINKWGNFQKEFLSVAKVL